MYKLVVIEGGTESTNANFYSAIDIDAVTHSIDSVVCIKSKDPGREDSQLLRTMCGEYAVWGPGDPEHRFTNKMRTCIECLVAAP